jgi:hypothetical protein
MQYLLSLWMEEMPMNDLPEEQVREMMAPWFEYNEALKSAGVYVSGDQLTPSASATSISTATGERVVTDGPFAETKEQMMGYYQIEVPDLDAALDWAAKVPSAAYGTVEVRAVVDNSSQGA